MGMLTASEENSTDTIEKMILMSLKADSLQLVVKDGLKDVSQHLSNVIAKASNIVNHVRKSICATRILKGRKAYRLLMQSDGTLSSG